MSFETRCELYKRIEEKRGKKLIAYVTSIRNGMSGTMAGDAIPVILNQLELIPKECKEIDFLIISNGGDPITALRIINLLRERFDKITVLVPYVAYSAATILALGADEIIMHSYSNLGPTDPQIMVTRVNPNGQKENFQVSSEDVRNYIDFAKTDVGVRKKDLVSILENIGKNVDALVLGSTKRGQRLSYALSMKLLKTHMKSKRKMKKIANNLSKAYYHHSYALGKTEVKNLGLNVINIDEELENLLWNVWKDFEIETKANNKFSVINEIMDNPEASKDLKTIPVLKFAANIPVEMVKQKMIQLIQQTEVVHQKSLEVNCLIAAIESVQKAYCVLNNISIVYWRNINMQLNTNFTITTEGWKERVES